MLFALILFIFGFVYTSIVPPFVLFGQSVVDPDPGSCAFLTLDPGSGMDKKSRSGSGIYGYIPDHISESLETKFFGFKNN
jgi:hypothetical protein